MSKKATTEELENQQEVIEQSTERDVEVHESAEEVDAAVSAEQSKENPPPEETEEKDIIESLDFLTAEGEVILTADTTEALNDKFYKLKKIAFDKKLAAGAISHDIDNEVYALQVNIIN